MRTPIILDTIPEGDENRESILSIRLFRKDRPALAVTILVELHRVIAGSFLVICVPQKCGDTACELFERVNSQDRIFVTNLGFSSFTMLVFILLYIFEIKRETLLLQHLEYNKYAYMDNISVRTALNVLSPKKVANILFINEKYKHVGYVSIGTFIINTLFSAYTIFTDYLDATSIVTFFTAVLFMALKMNNVYNVVRTEQHVFLSPYLKEYRQYNAIDNDAQSSFRSSRPE